MKNARFIITVLVFAMVAMVPAIAQTGNLSGSTKIAVPFEFNVGDKHMPAGDYTVTPVNASTLLLQSADRRNSIMFLTSAIETAKGAQPRKLVFNQYGDRYFLTQAWTQVSSLGRELFSSKAEHEMARNGQPAVVALGMN